MSETIILPRLGFGAAWRDAARGLLTHGVPPEHVHWLSEDNAPGLPFAQVPRVAPTSPAKPLIVPRALIALAEEVLCANVPERFSLPYRALWRQQAQRGLVADPADPDMAQLRVLAKLVRRDAHKMKAFVRFCEEDERPGARRQFSAWFEPDHYIVEATAPFFARRFGDMDWRIVTPKGCAELVMGELGYGAGQAKPVSLSDPTEGLWRTYYTNIFNPARLKVKAMQSEMPKKYWKNLPEADLIPALIAGANSQVQAMRERAASQPPPRMARMPAYQRPAPTDLAANLTRRELNGEIARCTRCPLHCAATQAVLGEGPDHAAIMVLGEQPGDQEDLAGRAFIGPAGQVLDAALGEAGLDRAALYVTNAVKHFKHEVRGKRRIHERPARTEIDLCRWWLKQEIALAQPQLVIALGATAAYAMTGNGKNVTRRQGMIEASDLGVPVLITGHPAAVLRAPSPVMAQDLRANLVSAFRAGQQLLVDAAKPQPVSDRRRTGTFPPG